MRKPAKCQVCKTEYAEFAVQYIASDEPSVYCLGEHIRGFSMLKVCWDCAQEIKAKAKS